MKVNMNKIKNWFIITRIRVLNFIKEHKYVSAVIGVFLLSIIISFVVRAADDTIDNAGGVDVNAVTITTESEDKTKAPNFSNVIYQVSYTLPGNSNCGQKVDEVKITAKIENNDYLKWNPGSEEVLSEISEDGKTLTLTMFSVGMCSKYTQNLSLSVLNAENDSDVKIAELQIQPGSNAEPVDNKVTIDTLKTSYDSKITDLTALVRPGVAVKKEKELELQELETSSATTGRNNKFGLLLGFYQEGETLDLKNKYISPDAKITLQAKESVGEEENNLELSTNPSDYGVYTDEIEKKHYFSSLPVLTSSGTATLSKNTISSEQVEEKTNAEGTTFETVITDYNSAPMATLYDNDNLEVERHSNGQISELQKKITIGNKEVECNNTNNCVFTSNVNFASNGTYDASYTITDKTGKNKTILKQKVNVVDPQDNTNSYALKGPKTLYIKDVKSFKDPGIESLNDEKSSNHETSVKYYAKDPENQETKTSKLEDLVKANEEGTYVQEYTISDKSLDNIENSVITIKREIVIGDNNKIQNEPLKVIDKTSISLGSNYNENELYIDGSKKTCDFGNSCTSSLNDDILNQIGEHEITYTISKENFDTIVTKTIIVEDQNYYTLSISDLKISSNIQLIKILDKNFFAIGSYYVTVPTDKESSIVSLTAFVNGQQEASTARIENKKVSTGTNTLDNDLYVVEKGSLVKVDNSETHYTAAMGEKVEVDTTFNYGMDADNDISDLTIKLDVDDDLTPTAQVENVEEADSSQYYYAEYYRFGEKIVEDAPTAEIKYCDSSTCKDPSDIDFSSTTISSVNLSFNGSKIKPGTTISLKTSYIVKTYTSDDLSNKSFNNNVTVSGTVNNEKIEIKKSTNTAYVTPYKLRTSLFAGLDGKETSSNIMVDVSKNRVYRVYALTDVSSPAMLLNTNYFGYDSLSKVEVTFTLPKGINYVSNSSYVMQPTKITRGETTTLTYTYSDVLPNSWIEAIYFDFTVDIATENGTTLTIESSTNVPNATGLSKDLSGDSLLKEKVDVTTQNVEKISYGQYIYSSNNSQMISNINKNGSFMFKTKLYNPNEEQVSNVSVYTILPYNDNSNLSSYTGTYKVSSFPSDAQCTTDEQAVISTGLKNASWKNCSEVNASDVVAYKVSYDSITAKQSKEASINIQTSNNSPGDKYNFSSYLQIDDNEELTRFGDIKVEVVSKTIRGIVWEDFDYDGIMQTDEKRVDAVELSLYTSDDDLVDTTTPNKNGEYSFTGISEGDYYVVADFNYDKYMVTASRKDYGDISKLNVFSSSEFEDINVINNDDEKLDQDEGIDKDNLEEDLENEDIDDEVDEPENSEDNVMLNVKTEIYSVTSDTTTIDHVNLGLALRKKFSVKVNKYITKTEVTNALGVVTKRDYGNAKLAKLDVKDINNLSIKVVYTIELQNVKYYPGYIKLVTEQIPDGMSFNPNYSENAGWVLNEDGTLSNSSLSNELLDENEKRYLTIAFDITRKEAGSFVNTVSVDDLEILGGNIDEE